jgi:hypothetical protein
MKHTITLSFSAWHKLQEQIILDYGRATLMISWRLRDTLGFTVREHRDYTQDEWEKAHTIRLDFYDEQLQTLFLLKYSNFIEPEYSA